MTSTIKVNNVQNQCGQNIINENSNTITIGASGDTIALASGASQSGFGRTGTVNWVTTKKTASFTAVSGEGYFCDTDAVGAFTLTLPSSPNAGDIVGLKDYNGNFATAGLTIGRNGSPINGGNSSDPTISTSGASIFLVYVDATQGWLATQDDESLISGKSFITATGGTITTCGDCKVHTFTSPGTFSVSAISSSAADNEVSYVVVAGGGGTGYGRGGGGAGGFRESKSPVTSYTASPLDGRPNSPNRITVTATGFPIAVGGGGAGVADQPSSARGTSGVNSTFSTITSAGGGGGGSEFGSAPLKALSGGSGGGESCAPYPGWVQTAGGAGNTPPTTPAQGNPGGNNGNGPRNNTAAGGGGGGAGAAGQNGGTTPSTNHYGGSGGAGVSTSITGSSVAYAGGGGGGGNPTPGTPNEGANGGTGGGGQGGAYKAPGGVVSTTGTVNTGGGGGGGSYYCTTNSDSQGSAGGSGIVIIRYKFQ